MSITTLEIWNDFSDRLRAFIRKRVGDPAETEDLLQEVFVKLHTGVDDLREDSRIAPWVFRVTRNAVIDHWRRRGRRVELPPRWPVEEEENQAETEIAGNLSSLIRSLPAKYALALELVELQGLTQRELADRMGLSLSGAKSRVQRGRALLRERLLECCHFEFDRRGHLIDYAPRPACCPHCAGDDRCAEPGASCPPGCG